MAGWIKMLYLVWTMEIGISPGDFVLDGDPAPAPQNGRSPQFSAHLYCGQTAGWIKITLGINVEHGPGHIVLDGDQAPSRKTEAEPPIIGPFLLWPNGWMHQDATLIATCYGGMPQSRQLC